MLKCGEQGCTDNYGQIYNISPLSRTGKRSCSSSTEELSKLLVSFFLCKFVTPQWCSGWKRWDIFDQMQTSARLASIKRITNLDILRGSRREMEVLLACDSSHSPADESPTRSSYFLLWTQREWWVSNTDTDSKLKEMSPSCSQETENWIFCWLWVYLLLV